MTFLGIGLAYDTILNKTEKVFKKFAWMSFPEIGLAHSLKIHQFGFIVQFGITQR